MDEVDADNRPKFLSVDEAAAVLGLCSASLYRAIASGAFPAVRVGRRLFVPGRALQDLAAAALATGRVVDAAGWRQQEAAG